ncbi:hypothetical protein JTE90_007609 [Oedothorax gibbosus]|uniref:GPN-loop GTPase n=1 Tax=Oedothorax gibbosus TaxID=931172 RepID=A0AAV6TKG3_9ARAC|nr:hypothetical protein JTE90_007609 [Oedothorax gibbosus]
MDATWGPIELARNTPLEPHTQATNFDLNEGWSYAVVALDFFWFGYNWNTTHCNSKVYGKIYGIPMSEDSKPGCSKAASACDISDIAGSLSDVKLSQSNKPVCIIVLGMAGSRKTTFVQRITSYLHSKQEPPYVINLDPACRHVPYPANIDIRETVKYKDVMKHYSLGPNGGIMTSLNMFATRFDQVLGLIDKNSSKCKYVILDTPGQIEVVTWSASGMIITEALSASYPTIVVYVMDIVRSAKPVTFMSNML